MLCILASVVKQAIQASDNRAESAECLDGREHRVVELQEFISACPEVRVMDAFECQAEPARERLRIVSVLG
jgi:hypothetical protein